MKVHFVFLIISFVIIIQAQGYRGQYGGSPQNYPQYKGQGSRDGLVVSGRNVAGRSRALGLGNAAEKVVGFVSAKAKGIVKLIRCVLQCFIKYFVSNYCNRMFPCLYDCSIGENYIAPEIEKQIKSAKTIYPGAFQLKSVFKIFRCLYDCALDKPIKNWETFATALYCVADTCICFNLLGQGMN